MKWSKMISADSFKYFYFSYSLCTFWLPFAHYFLTLAYHFTFPYVASTYPFITSCLLIVYTYTYTYTLLILVINKFEFVWDGGPSTT